MNPATDEEMLLEALSCPCLRCRHERHEGVTIAGLFLPVEAYTMVVCPTCGSKRCPHSDDHRNACTGSNRSGQPGSRYA